MPEIDWSSVFALNVHPLEIFLRGTFMYLAMFALLRVFRRQSGSFSIADLLVIVVIADAGQNGMAGEQQKSVTDSILLITTIIGWDFFLDWIGFKSKFFGRILEPKRLEVVKNGSFLHRNMQKEMITQDELESQMRQNGIEHVSEIKSACLESDGHFSFIKKDAENEQSNSEEKQNDR